MFVAVTPSPDGVEDLGDFLEPRQEAGTDLRWTAPEQWHVTLAFMAEVPERAVDELLVRLARAAARHPGFDAALRGGGAFPNPARGKVLWTGVELVGPTPDDPRQHPLRRLAWSARAAANRAGAPADGGPFHPHLTLARTGRPRELTRWIRVLDGYAGPAWPVAELTLFASHLGEGAHRRPRHEPVATFPLDARAAPAEPAGGSAADEDAARG